MTDVLPADLLSRVRQSHKREEGYVAAGKKKKKTICSSLLSVLGVCVCVCVVFVVHRTALHGCRRWGLTTFQVMNVM